MKKTSIIMVFSMLLLMFVACPDGAKVNNENNGKNNLEVANAIKGKSFTYFNEATAETTYTFGDTITDNKLSYTCGDESGEIKIDDLKIENKNISNLDTTNHWAKITIDGKVYENLTQNEKYATILANNYWQFKSGLNNHGKVFGDIDWENRKVPIIKKMTGGVERTLNSTFFSIDECKESFDGAEDSAKKLYEYFTTQKFEYSNGGDGNGYAVYKKLSNNIWE